MPVALKLYLFAIFMAAAAIAAVLLPDLSFSPAPIQAALTMLVVAGIADMAPNAYRNVEAGATDAILIAAAMVLPPPVLALVLILATLPSELLAHKPWFKIGFNVAYRLILFTILAQLARRWGAIPTPDTPIPAILFLFSTLITYTLVTTVSLAGVVALMERRPLLAAWRDEWRGLSFFDLALVPYGLILGWLWQLNTVAFLTGLLPLVIVHRMFSVQVRLLEEQAATQRLVKQQRELQEATTALLSAMEVRQQISALFSHLRSIFGALDLSVILWDTDGAIEHLHDQAAEPFDAETLVPMLRDAVNSGAMRRLSPETATGIRKPMLVLPLATAAGPLGCLLLLTDDPLPLTHDEEGVLTTFAGHAALAIYQAKLAEQVKDSHRQVVQSSRLASVGTLAAGVAHEFNNLLAVISGTAEIAQGGPADEQERALQTIVDAARRGSSVTRGLLTFARRMTPLRQYAAITEAIEPVLALLEHEFAREQIVVERRYHAVPATVYDLGMISQVVLNLLTNSRDAMRPRGGTIVVAVDQAGPNLRVAVRDNGAGIPAQLLDRIFDPFMTTKTPSSGSGTGLGLSISYGIVADHGGKIVVDSVEGQGTTITVLLPIVQEPPGTAPARRVASGARARRVVVVDDEPLIAQAIHQFLTREGYSSRVFTKPEEALAAIRAAPTDFVVADFSMPGMDGVTLIERVGAAQGPTACVLITGEVEDRHVQRARTAGVEHILEKPFAMQELQATLAELRPAVAAGRQECVAAGGQGLGVRG